MPVRLGFLIRDGDCGANKRGFFCECWRRGRSSFRRDLLRFARRTFFRVLRESVKKVDTFVGRWKIESVPGPSALTAALSIAGVPWRRFSPSLGFLPHKKGRETLFKEIAVSERTMVFYEITAQDNEDFRFIG